jgi:hypothetical protein
MSLTNSSYSPRFDASLTSSSALVVSRRTTHPSALAFATTLPSSLVHPSTLDSCSPSASPTSRPTSSTPVVQLTLLVAPTTVLLPYVVRSRSLLFLAVCPLLESGVELAQTACGAMLLLVATSVRLLVRVLLPSPLTVLLASLVDGLLRLLRVESI